jgi:hypothetical protein
MDRLVELAMDLVRLDVQVAAPSTVAQAARQATVTMPGTSRAESSLTGPLFR